MRWCAPHNNTKTVGATRIYCDRDLPGQSCMVSEYVATAVFGLRCALLSVHLGKGAGQAFEPRLRKLCRSTSAEDRYCVSMRQCQLQGFQMSLSCAVNEAVMSDASDPLNG